MQEFHAVNNNDLAGGLITDEQADNLFELSSLQLIVHAFGMVGGKKLAETATNSAMRERPDVHAGVAAHQTKIGPFFDDLRRMNFTNAEACLEHIQASHLTNFIRLAAGTKSLLNEVRDVYDKVADKIRSDSVKDLSINTLAKAAKYSLELHSVFESEKINPVVKKMFDPSFKKKYQEENDLRALHGRNDTRGEDMRGGRRARGGAGRERGRGPSNERGRGREKSADQAKSPDRGEVMCLNCDSTEHRTNDLKCPKMAPKSRTALQKRADSSEGNKGEHKMRDNMRELHQLRNEKKAHFRKLGAKTNEADLEEGSGFDKSDWGDDDEEERFAAGAVKSHKCFGVKCATICACNAIRSFSLATPVLSMSDPVRTAVLTPVSMLRTTTTVFPQHALVVSDTFFKLSQAYEAHERALSWEISPRA